MRSKRPSMLGPGGKLIASVFGGLVALFLIWNFVITPIFINRTNTTSTANSSDTVVSATNPGTNSTSNSSQSTGTNSTSTSDKGKPVATGQVVDASSGVGVANAVLTLGQTQLATTDNSGNFSIYQKLSSTPIVVTAPGYAQATLDPKNVSAIHLNPNSVSGTLVDAATKQPLGGMPVKDGDITTSTDKDGKFTLNRVTDGSTLEINMIGYAPISQKVDLKNTSPLNVAAQSTQLNGTITDAQTGKPVANARLQMGDQVSLTNGAGGFYFSNAAKDDTAIKIRAPGYKIQNFTVADARKGIKMVPFHFRGVYVPGIFAIRANYNDLFTPYLQMADKGEINAIVVGVKDDDTGELFYDSQAPLAKQYNLIYGKGQNSAQLIDIQHMLADAHKHGLYVAARFVVTRDPYLAKVDPKIAVHDTRTGGLWQDNNSHLNWINPSSDEEVNYTLSLSKELSQLGFDEVQFDYIRFPADPPLKYTDFGNGMTGDFVYDDKSQKAYDFRTQAVDKVVSTSYNYLKNTDTFLSLDVFGVTLWRVDDNNIGQQYNDMIMISDYICPMVYPSHFLPGTLNFPDPGNHPKEIIQESGKYSTELENKLHPVAKYRPWLEDFDYPWGAHPYTYGPDKVKVQITTADATGASGWTLWNAVGKYTNTVLAATEPSANN